MKLSEYKSKDFTQFYNDFKPWNHACVVQEELPEELKTAYHEIWSDTNDANCYLAKYKEQYGLAFINQFQKSRKECHLIPELYSHMLQKATEYSDLSQFQDVQVILCENSGAFGGHEFITFIPWDTPRELFFEISDILTNTLYKQDKTTDIIAETNLNVSKPTMFL